MKVTYNGVTGELVKLECKEKVVHDVGIRITLNGDCLPNKKSYIYTLVIETGKDTQTTFSNVDFAKIKWHGAVSLEG